MIEIQKDLCIGCGKCVKDCVAVCPKAAVFMPEYDMAEVEEYKKDSFSINSENLLHAIKFRRSIRDYKEQKIEPEKIEKLVQAGRFTATAKNNQGCHFILVQQEIENLKELVWEYIDEATQVPARELPEELLPFVVFKRQHKAKPTEDFLFRNAPAVLYITSDWDLDAGLAAQNIELMAVSEGLGALYNGYLQRISDRSEKLKTWLGIEGEKIKACMLLGYPNITYARTAPRREAHVSIR